MEKFITNKRLKFAILGIFILIVLWIIYNFYKAYLPNQNRIYAQVDAKTYVLSSKVAGRVKEIYVKKGDMVQKGDLIYEIDSPELTAKINQAKAGYEAAKALSKEAKQGSREEIILSAKNVYEGAKSMSDLAQKTYQRIESLYKTGVISEQKRDEAYAQYLGASHQEQSALSQYNLALKGATAEQKIAVEKKEEAAFMQVSEIESYALDTQIFSLSNGEISNILLNVGELSPSGFPIVSVVDLDDAWIRFSVAEVRLSEFKKGEKIHAFIPALDKEYEFVVSYIAPLGDFSTWRATSSNKGYDTKSFEIHARPTQKIDGLKVGLSAIIE